MLNNVWLWNSWVLWWRKIKTICWINQNNLPANGSNLLFTQKVVTAVHCYTEEKLYLIGFSSHSFIHLSSFLVLPNNLSKAHRAWLNFITQTVSESLHYPVNCFIFIRFVHFTLYPFIFYFNITQNKQRNVSSYLHIKLSSESVKHMCSFLVIWFTSEWLPATGYWAVWVWVRKMHTQNRFWLVDFILRQAFS